MLILKKKTQLNLLNSSLTLKIFHWAFFFKKTIPHLSIISFASHCHNHIHPQPSHKEGGNVRPVASSLHRLSSSLFYQTCCLQRLCKKERDVRGVATSANTPRSQHLCKEGGGGRATTIFTEPISPYLTYHCLCAFSFLMRGLQCARAIDDESD